jgi:hypothetical protein
MESDSFSATMIVGMFVLPFGQKGMIEASPTRTPLTPLNRPSESVTAMGSLARPIRQVEVGCQLPITFFIT